VITKARTQAKGFRLRAARIDRLPSVRSRQRIADGILGSLGREAFKRGIDGANTGSPAPALRWSRPESALLEGHNVVGRDQIDRVAPRRDAVQSVFDGQGGPAADQLGQTTRLTRKQMLDDDQCQIW